MWVKNNIGQYATQTSLPGGVTTSISTSKKFQEISFISDGEGCTVADIDGDLDIDIMWSSSTAVEIAINDGTFSFQSVSPNALGLPAFIGPSEISDWVWGDCDSGILTKI